MAFFTSGVRGSELEAAALEASMRAVEVCRESAHVMPFDWDEHERWRIERGRESLRITIGDPESRGSYLTKHMTFLVTEQMRGTCVRRRFSDFAWLHDVLKARYVGLLVPSLPEKNNVLKNEAFMQSRVRGLSLFAKHLAESPYLSGDKAVTSFLTIGGDEEWDAAKKASAVLENGGSCHMRWIKRIATFPLPQQADLEVTAFKRYVEQQERVLSELVPCCKRLAEKSAAMCKEVGELDTLLNGWAVSETTASTTDEAFVTTLEQTTTVTSKWGQVVQYEPGIYELTLYEGVRYLYHQARDLKVMLASREAAHAIAYRPAPAADEEVSPTAASTAASAAAVATAAASTLASRLRSVTEPSPADLEQNQKRAQHACELMTRALFAEEMIRFRSQRNGGVEEMMQKFACAQGQLAKKSTGIWREYVKTNVADPQALVDSTKEIFDGAVPATEPKHAHAY